MRLTVAGEPLRRILWWTQRALFAAGVLLLAWCAFVLVDARIFQQGERRQLERLVTNRQETNGGTRETALTASPKVPQLPVAGGGLVGRIEIPRLGLSAIVMEGIGASILRRAVGHIPGTALPGRPGNVCISGHRDTFFRPLRNIRQNDVITLTTVLGEFRYRVVSTRIVRPNNLAVLDAGGDEILTLITCYPFYFVGPAPTRYVVRAERVGTTS
jgi:sortase A